MGFCPIFGIWQDAGAPATSQMRCWLLPNGRIFPAAAGILCALNPRFSALPARRRNVGFFCRAAHTLAVGAKNRTQRRHAPHVALRAFDTPAGSIVPIFFTGGKSARSALFRQMRRSPLLFRNKTKMPFCLRVSTLFRIWCEKLFGVQLSIPAGSIFSNSAFAGALISGSFCRSSERRFSI